MNFIMDTTYSRKPSRASILSAAILAGTLGCGLALSARVALAQDSAPQQDQAPQNAGQRSDGQIEMDVVHALDADPALKQDFITAGTVQGEVTLSGTSLSEANRQLAESIAKKVSGVTKVVNSLKVGDPTVAQDGANQPQQPDNQYPDPSPQVADDGNQPRPAPQGYPQTGPQNGPQNYPQNGPQNGPQYGPQSGARPAYRPAPNQQPYIPPQYAQIPDGPRTPVTLPEGTLLKVRTSEMLDSKRAKDGESVEFTVVRDVYAGGVLAIPRGAVITGEVTHVKKAGALGGSPELGLNLDTLQLEGKAYDLDTDPFEVKGPNKAGRTAGNAIGGALLGALIGGAVGGGEGAAIGAGAGAAGGTAASAATPGGRVWIPAESPMDFHLDSAVTITPVSRQEAMRLASSVQPTQRPTLNRRGPYPYGGYPPPPGYYRPY
jgi:hypothetical protein